MILDFKDEALCTALNHVISGLLPHENYKNSFAILYPSLISVLNIRDVQGIHYIFFAIFEKYYSLVNAINQKDFNVCVTRERFENALANNLPDFILEPQLRVEEIMYQEGKSGDITIPTIQNDAMNVVFSRVMSLYDECFDLKQTYEDAVARLVDLKDSIRLNVIDTGIQMQREIISVGRKYNGKFYRGSTGWQSFTSLLVKEISELNSLVDDDLNCVGLDVLPRIEEQTIEMSEGLAEYGIPQLDDKTPMLKHRLVTFVAKENTGKTKVITHLAATLIRSGVKVYFACGETPPQIAFMNVVSSYIYQEYGLYFETGDLTGAGFRALSEEDKQVVQSAKAAVALSGSIFNNNLEYDNVIPTFTEAYRRGCQAFFVDHTQSLRIGNSRGRKIKDFVYQLAVDCRDFKRQYPVYVCLASQPSTDLKDIFQKEQSKDIQQSPTAQSANVSQESDEVFILHETPFLKKQNILCWIVFKRRDGDKPQPFFIRKLFHVSSYKYDPTIQSGDNVDAQEIEGILRSVSTDSTGFNDVSEEDEADLQVDF